MRMLAPVILSLILATFSVSTSNAEISEARNFHQFSENVLSSGQPDQALLEKAADDGIEVVINLVPTSEGIYNPREGEILKKQGIEYIHNPVNWGNPKEAELKSFLQTMKKVGDKKVLVHCWSNARASAFVYAYRVSQEPNKISTEFKDLKKIWKEVAGYSLDTNQTWNNFLERNVGNAQ